MTAQSNLHRHHHHEPDGASQYVNDTAMPSSSPKSNVNSNGIDTSNNISSSSSWLDVCVAEEMNPSRRCNMEDCYVVHAPGTWNAADPEMAYLGVYDGHGGRDVAVYLKRTLAKLVASELAASDEADTVKRLSRAFLMADVCARCQLVETRSGATVAICLIQKLGDANQFHIVAANVGDARIVLGHNGNATRLTCDHKADNDDEVERIRQAGGFCFKGRVSGVLAVTRSLGDFYLKDYVIAEPFVSEHTILLKQQSSSSTTTNLSQQQQQQQQQQQPSFVVLACDGLWDVMTDQEVVDFVGSFDGERNQVARYLIKEAIRRGSADNITVVVAMLSGC